MRRRTLKPCPWCGSMPFLKEDKLWRVYSYNGHTTTHGYTGAYEYYYQCSNEDCNATAPHGKCDTIYHSVEEAKQWAKDAWQKRGEEECLDGA